MMLLDSRPSIIARRSMPFDGEHNIALQVWMWRLSLEVIH